MINRNRLFYSRTPAALQRLDFSVEHLWTCPPMPSRAYRERSKFLTMPKSDLIVCNQQGGRDSGNCHLAWQGSRGAGWQTVRYQSDSWKGKGVSCYNEDCQGHTS